MANVSISNCFGCGLFLFIYQHQSLRKYPKAIGRFFWGLFGVLFSFPEPFFPQNVGHACCRLECCQHTQLLKNSKSTVENLPMNLCPSCSRTYFTFIPFKCFALPFFINYHFEHHAALNVPTVFQNTIVLFEHRSRRVATLLFPSGIPKANEW